ncbi:MAG TPA: hypothetical protein VKB76_01715, partial [Ktedonobacterales bacterium]|nr:hypothetical protein [Ktedonobacterales bacterium]
MEHETQDLAQGSGFGKGYDFAPGRGERMLRWAGAYAKRMVKRLLRAAFGTVGQIDAWLHGWEHRLPLDTTTYQPRRILVVRTDMLGDLVLTLPLIEALHRAYPDAEIDVAAMPSTAGIVQGHPLIARVITCDPNTWLDGFFSATQRREIRATIRTLQAAHYDLAVSVCGDWGSIITWLSRARR